MDGYYEDADSSYPTTRMNGQLKNSCMSWAAAHTAVPPPPPKELTLGMYTPTSPDQAEITEQALKLLFPQWVGRKDHWNGSPLTLT